MGSRAWVYETLFVKNKKINKLTGTKMGKNVVVGGVGGGS